MTGLLLVTRSKVRVWTLIGVATLLAGCSSGGEPDTEVTGMPQSWLTETAHGWPTSDGYGKGMPFLSRGSCLLGEAPEVLEVRPRITDVGWGSFGPDTRADDSYLYLCHFWESGRYAGDVRLYQAADESALDALAQDFADRPSHGNELTFSETISHGANVSILRTWIPSNPQGKVEALYLDPVTTSAVIVEVNSLSEEDFAAYTDELAAADLMALLAAATS